MNGDSKVDLDYETSSYLKRGALDSTTILRVFENKDTNIDQLSEKDKALYKIYLKKDIDLKNIAESNVHHPPSLLSTFINVSPPLYQ